MFRALGKTVSRAWPAFLCLWLVILVVTALAAPPWNDVAQDDEFAFLPKEAPSQQGELLMKQAFPDENLGSTVVLVFRRDTGLLLAEKNFWEVVEKRLRAIADADGGLAEGGDASEAAAQRSIIARIRMPTTPGTGTFLRSSDSQAALVVVELTTEFMSRLNWKTIEAIETLVRDLHTEGRLPEGLEVSLTGSAVLGRDRVQGQLESVRATEFWTVALVVILLMLIYRAPLVAAIPLVTVFLAVQFSLHLLAILARAGWITLFEGIQAYITVVAYGAGVDYCLFLTARFKEELDAGSPVGPATENAVAGVGAALTASAATVMCGIGMMVFAQFGKFRQAGIAMPLSLLIVLAATLTFSAALLRLVGRWAFWPQRIGSHIHEPDGRLVVLWKRLGQTLLRWPGTVLVVSVAILAPFAVGALTHLRHQSYDWIETLPAQSPSRLGTQVLQKHFPAGLMGPVVALVVAPEVDFDSPDGRQMVQRLTDRLVASKDQLQLADIRSLTQPLGITAEAGRALESGLPASAFDDAVNELARTRYLTDFGERKKIGTRFELIFNLNPFSSHAMMLIGDLGNVLRDSKDGGLANAEIHLIGNTASLRDVKAATEGDQLRIEVLVVVSVFLILLAVVRSLWISSYMILSVLFCYLVTLGVSQAFFWLLEPETFSGLDWKVGIFLFTILIAVGEDYNIFLFARVQEEQQNFGMVRGVVEALSRTGPIISSCGLIMAGTFASLAVGPLPEMKQLGFALAFGVLLDTFVVRPILVPAFLIILYRARSPSRGIGTGDEASNLSHLRSGHLA